MSARPDHLYCQKHEMYRVKDTGGNLVCIKCLIEDEPGSRI